MWRRDSHLNYHQRGAHVGPGQGSIEHVHFPNGGRGSKKSHKEKSTQEPPGSSQALAAQTARQRDQNDSSYLLQQTAHLRFCRLKMWLKVTFRMKEALCYSSSQKPTASAPAHLSLFRYDLPLRFDFISLENVYAYHLKT